MKEFSHIFIARLTQIDCARTMAFLALDEGSGQMLGAVQLHADVNHETGEYAILLRSDLKGRGLGWLLMQAMIEYASTDGLRVIEGQVLRDNTTMLRMCGELGFKVEPDPEDPGLCRVLLDLTTPEAAGDAPLNWSVKGMPPCVASLPSSGCSWGAPNIQASTCATARSAGVRSGFRNVASLPRGRARQPQAAMQ